MTNPKAYMSPSWVGTAFLKPYLEGASSSGAMNVIVPPSNVRLDDMGFCGSSTMVVNPKSARHALGGVSLVMSMFAYRRIRKRQIRRVVARDEPL
jgi:hypothetical protein